MDDSTELTSPLARAAGVSPLAQAAGGGNNLQQQLFQQMLDKNNSKQTYLQQQQAAYNTEMNDYANMVKQSQQPVSQSGNWAAAATAASKFAPTWGNIGQGIAAAGGAAGEANQNQRQLDLKNQQSLTQMRQNEVRALEAKDQTAALMKSMQPAKSNWIQFKDDAGNLHLMDKSQGPGTETVVPATQNALWAKLLAQGNAIAVKQDEPDKPQYALEYATQLMRTMKPGLTATSTQQPATTSIGQPVAATSLPANGSNTQVGQEPAMQIAPSTQITRDAAANNLRKGEVTGALPNWPTMPAEVSQQLSPADKAVVDRLTARINANPSAAQNDTRTLESILAKYNTQSTAQPGGNSIAAAAGRKTAAEENAKLGIAQQMKSAQAQGANEGKQIADASEKKTTLENYLAEAGQTKDVVNSLIDHPGLEKATGMEGYIPGRGRVTPLAGSDSAEFMQALKTLESRVTSLALQNARVGSSSGATGFGALDAGEREMLRDSMASLSLQQSPEKLRQNLQKIRNIIANSEQRAKEGYARTYIDKTAPAASTEAAPMDAYQAWKAKKGLK